MRLEFLNFISQWGEPIDPTTVPADYQQQFADQLPGLMLDMWREIGFAGFGDGLLWVCDPRTWQPVVNTWLRGLDLPETHLGNHIPLFRTAYGEVFCFTSGLGLKTTITPLVPLVSVSRPDPVPGQRWIDMDIETMLKRPAHMFLIEADTLYDSEDDQHDLFPRLAEQLGRTTHDTIYSFSPPPQEGGDIRVENAILADAVSELSHLRTLETPEVFID